MYFKVEFKLLLKCKANYYWKRKANANWVRSYIPCAFLPNSVQQKNNTILTRARHPCGRPNSPSDPSDFTATVLGWGFWSRVPLGPCYIRLAHLWQGWCCHWVHQSPQAVESLQRSLLLCVLVTGTWSVSWRSKSLRGCVLLILNAALVSLPEDIMFVAWIFYFGVALLNASLISSGSRAPWDPFWFLCLRQSSLIQCQSALTVFYI